jgi:hypothetical protein
MRKAEVKYDELYTNKKWKADKKEDDPSIIEDSNDCSLAPNDPDPVSWKLNTPSYIGWKSVITWLNG